MNEQPVENVEEKPAPFISKCPCGAECGNEGGSAKVFALNKSDHGLCVKCHIAKHGRPKHKLGRSPRGLLQGLKA